MMNRRKEKELELKERRSQRDGREEAAGKLVLKVPGLASLSIDIFETRAGGVVSDTHYIRRVVVEHAAALFEVPCSDTRCEDGGYDVTREIVSALSSHRAHFEGRQTCRGRCGDSCCDRVLRYVAKATYRQELGVQ